jgi:hypothetical protein
MSHIGIQMVAPEGFGPLEKGVVYHFVARNERNQLILFAVFSSAPRKQNMVELVAIKCENFDRGVDENRICVAEKEMALPPWLFHAEGRDLKTLDEYRSRQKTNEKMVNERFEKILPLLAIEDQILLSDNPFQKIDQHARSKKPEINKVGLRCWFFTYVCFGRDKWMLMPAYPNCGRGRNEDTDISPYDPKYGAPSHKGRGCGYRMTEEIKVKVVECYQEHKRLGKWMTEIHADSLREDFGCKSRKAKNQSGLMEFYHPKEDPFPTYYQFKRIVHSRIGKEQVQIDLYGAVRTRTKKSHSKGAFTSNISRILQKVEGDGYYVLERPKGFIDGEPMPPLSVVKIRDYLTGQTVGIGFSLGAERASAYQMALFCMAISKKIFCSYFGLTINENDWPGFGLPKWIRLDRGPGGRTVLIEEFGLQIPINEITPSYQGQSKAVVETSHPKKLKKEGQPKWVFSNKNYVELMKAQIELAIKFNKTNDQSEKFSDFDECLPIPNELYRYFSKRLRTDAKTAPFDSLVRNLLSEHMVTVRQEGDGVYLHGQRYWSEALESSGILNRVVGNPEFKLSAYSLGVVARNLWVEVDGKLIEVFISFKVLVDNSKHYISILEIEEKDRKRKKFEAQLREHRAAEDAKMKQHYKDQTGKELDTSSQRTGRNKSTRSAQQEFNRTKKVTQGG